MPIFRGLLLLAAVWLAVVVARQLYRSYQRQRMNRPQTPARPLPTRVVRCQQCGVHIPETEAIANGDRYFCSNHCRSKHRAP
jgi:uncharacterized protein